MNQLWHSVQLIKVIEGKHIPGWIVHLSTSNKYMELVTMLTQKLFEGDAAFLLRLLIILISSDVKRLPVVQNLMW